MRAKTPEEARLIKTYQGLLDASEDENQRLIRQLKDDKLIRMVVELRAENYRLKKLLHQIQGITENV